MGGGKQRAAKSAKTEASILSYSIGLLILGITASLLLLFWNIRFFIRSTRWPPIDAEKKYGERGHGWDVWEFTLCCLVPVIAWTFRGRLIKIVWGFSTRTGHPFMILLLLLLSIIPIFVIQNLVSQPECHGWIRSDVGLILASRQHGHNMNAICNNRVWEPHVANAITDYLFGQGRAIDVGAFIGYHTLRLAKQAAPFNVLAFEGRTSNELKKNLQQNNAINVKVVKETIDSSWQLDEKLAQSLLDEEKGPLAFVKIDCEGCELYFLRGARVIFDKWHPVIVLEIQDNETRSTARIGGQQMVLPKGTKEDVLGYLREDLGYTVTALHNEHGEPTWDYLAIQPP